MALRLLYSLAVALLLAFLILRSWDHQMVWLSNESLWRHVIKLNPKAKDAHMNLSSELLHQGQLKEALAYARYAVETEPHSTKAQLNLVNILYLLGHHEEALSVCLKAIEQIRSDAQLSDAYVKLGAIYAALGQLDKAIYHTNQALAIDPNNKSAQQNRAVLQP